MSNADVLPERWRKLNVGLMRSTFLPRDLPDVIMDVDGLALRGPFCRHCGNRSEDHTAVTMRCPNTPLFNLLPPPSCGCHGTPAQALASGRSPVTGRPIPEAEANELRRQQMARRFGWG